MLGATAAGADTTVDRLLRQVGVHRGTNADRTTLLRILLLSQIDVVWWGSTEPYHGDADVCARRSWST